MLAKDKLSSHFSAILVRKTYAHKNACILNTRGRFSCVDKMDSCQTHNRFKQAHNRTVPLCVYDVRYAHVHPIAAWDLKTGAATLSP